MDDAEVTVLQVREAKEIALQKIQDAINEFHDKTGLSITSVDFALSQTIGDKYLRLIVTGCGIEI